MLRSVLARWLRPLAGITVVIAAAGLAVVPLLPAGGWVEPAPEAFSTDRALALVERIATEPRPVGSPASDRARRVIIAELGRLGLRAELQVTEAPDYFGLNDGRPVEVVNVLARIPGTTSTGAVALVGHYDTAPTTAGAADDASAVAVMLEAARAILAGVPPRNDVLLLFTDGEEPAPRFGSSAFVAAHPAAAELAFVINLEAIGSAGPSMPIGAAGPDGMAIEHYAASVPQPVAYAFLTATTSLIGGSISDFASFRDAGVPGIELAYVHGSSIYHTMADAPGRLGRASLQHHGESTLALARYLADLDLGQPPETERTVYHTIGRVLVSQPAWVTLLAWILAGAALVLATVAAGRSGAPRPWAGAGRSLLAGLIAVTVSAILAVLAWGVIAGARGDMGVGEGYLYLGGLVALTLAVHAATASLAGVGHEPVMGIGAAGLWWGLAFPLVVIDPGIGYLLVWPALVAGVLMLLRRMRERDSWLAVLGFGIVSAASIVLVLPAIEVFYQLAQPRPGNVDSQTLWIIAVPAILCALLVELLTALWPRPAPRRAS